MHRRAKWAAKPGAAFVPNAVRRFCSSLQQHIIAIRTMSLDDPSWFDRQADAWTSDMQPWERLEGSVAAFEKYPQ
jgi:hypothetical protein